MTRIGNSIAWSFLKKGPGNGTSRFNTANSLDTSRQIFPRYHMTFETADRPPLVGIVLACAGYACFALQDALAKWLVADYAVTEILFMRSLVIIILAAVLGHIRGCTSILGQPSRIVLVRAVLMLFAWLLFFTAAGGLELAELMTLSFSAPILILLLARLLWTLLFSVLGRGNSPKPPPCPLFQIGAT
ncbi:hypothetical protein [Rhizobium sp. 007]|uniref:hypothetical protein n=1 Tax=Rhizobium sp. 007 TaxID=2785056 RepID=UPI00188FAF6F|nr:hypothetical protein [Rhizobium sp. 007]QPB24450.1 hypothetical protein ISN39_33380 [Rhizobium sp. 007]